MTTLLSFHFCLRLSSRSRPESLIFLGVLAGEAGEGWLEGRKQDEAGSLGRSLALVLQGSLERKL